MTPIFVDGTYAGVLCVGQFLRDEHPPATFEDLWNKVGDIPGLNHDDLLGCFSEIPVLTETEIEALMHRVNTAATAFGRMWEEIVQMVARESDSARLNVYRVRELAEMLLCSEAFVRQEAEVRARAIGLMELPTAALVAQLDPAAIDTLRLSPGERSSATSELISAAHECEGSLPNIIVTSIRSGEVVILLRPTAVRNPGLRTLQLSELARTISERTKVRVRVPVLVGIGSDVGDPTRIASSYREAQRNMWLSGDAGSADLGVDAPGMIEQWPSRLPPDANEYGDMALVSWCLEALRSIGCVCEADAEHGRRMFVKTLDSILYLLSQRGVGDDELNVLRTRFSNDYDTLRTYNDMTAWFQAHLLQYLEETLEGPPTKALHVVRDACALVAESREAPTSRKEVAGKLGLSASHLGKLFTDVTGLRFRDYLVLSRIAQAQELLLDPRRSVRDVANEVGYSDPAAFSRAFSRVCGVTPSAFKQRPGACDRVRIKQAPKSTASANIDSSA